MPTQEIFVIEPQNAADANALRAFAKALKLKFQVSKGNAKDEILENVRKGFRELKLVQEGKMKTTPAKEFLDEL